jgi:hypothetical protein
LKIKIWKIACACLVFLTIFLIICICGLRYRADNLQVQLEQSIEVEEQSLKPCPICGEEVKLNPVNDSFYIECSNFFREDGCGLSTGYYDSKMELIEQWNDMKILPSN